MNLILKRKKKKRRLRSIKLVNWPNLFITKCSDNPSSEFITVNLIKHKTLINMIGPILRFFERGCPIVAEINMLQLSGTRHEILEMIVVEQRQVFSNNVIAHYKSKTM